MKISVPISNLLSTRKVLYLFLKWVFNYLQIVTTRLYDRHSTFLISVCNMYNPKNEKLVSWTKLIMILGGLWNLPITNNNILKSVFYMYSVFMRVSCFLFWCFLVSELIRLTVNKYELSVIMASLSVVVNDSKILSKVIIYLKHDLLELYGKVIEKEKKIWESESEEIKKMYKKMIRTCRLYVIALTSSTAIAVWFLVITGAVATIKLKEHNEAYNDTLEPHFMYQTILPLNKLEHLYWTFAMQVYWAWVGLIHNAGTHLIFVTLLVYAASQMRLLQIKFRNYVKPGFEANASKEEIEEKILVLKSLIRDHQQIIEFVSHLNKCTKYVIMMEFILSSLDMASVSVNLIKAKSSDVVFLLFFILVLLVQISLIGWTCNEIKVQSEAIADAIYESNWYLLNKEAKQLIEIIIARAQKPLLMTIGPFGPMTMNSVLLVIKAAYSYVSIMKE